MPHIYILSIPIPELVLKIDPTFKALIILSKTTILIMCNIVKTSNNIALYLIICYII